MNSKRGKLISPIKKYGGKSYIAKKIISVMDYRPTFVEGFAGTAIISLALDEVFDRHYCFDLDRDLINFWQVLQREGDRLYRFMLNTEYGEENFEQAKKYLKDNAVEVIEPFFHAAMYLVCNRMSRSADMKTFGWSDRLRRGLPEYISAYQTMTHNLPRITGLVHGINFQQGDYTELMVENNLCEDGGVVQYLDPPYLGETRVSPKAYGQYEMSNWQHECLLEFLKYGVFGVTYLSGYASELYNDKLKDYQKWSWKVKASSGQGKIKMTREELLWRTD